MKVKSRSWKMIDHFLRQDRNNEDQKLRGDAQWRNKGMRQAGGHDKMGEQQQPTD